MILVGSAILLQKNSKNLATVATFDSNVTASGRKQGRKRQQKPRETSNIYETPLLIDHGVTDSGTTDKTASTSSKWDTVPVQLRDQLSWNAVMPNFNSPVPPVAV